MKTIEVEGRVDESHRLTADVPAAVRPGAVRVRITLPDDEEEAGARWAAAVAAAWAGDWSDPREDIYTFEHGQPIDAVEGQGNAGE